MSTDNDVGEFSIKEVQVHAIAEKHGRQDCRDGRCPFFLLGGRQKHWSVLGDGG
jgi:hypothetical protein